MGFDVGRLDVNFAGETGIGEYALSEVVVEGFLTDFKLDACIRFGEPFVEIGLFVSFAQEEFYFGNIGLKGLQFFGWDKG
jgi:hypothetical protein